jgi:hypothetical protein
MINFMCRQRPMGFVSSTRECAFSTRVALQLSGWQKALLRDRRFTDSPLLVLLLSLELSLIDLHVLTN